jgi:hypothetical protein
MNVTSQIASGPVDDLVWRRLIALADYRSAMEPHTHPGFGGELEAAINHYLAAPKQKADEKKAEEWSGMKIVDPELARTGEAA